MKNNKYIGNANVDEGKMDVTINDSTNALFQYFLVQELKDNITLTAAAEKDDSIVNVSAGHGFTGIGTTPGEMITIFENSRLIQSPVISVAADAITLEIPLAFPLSTNAIVVRGNKNLNVNGSGTPIDFIFKLRNWIVPIDINKVVILSIHTTTSDYTKFMGLAELTNGMYFRKENSLNFNLGNYRNNKDFRLKGATVDFPTKVPSGTYATEIVFDLISIFGQVERFFGTVTEFFKAVVRDDLSTLTDMEISLIGSYTKGEV